VDEIVNTSIKADYKESRIDILLSNYDTEPRETALMQNPSAAQRTYYWLRNKFTMLSTRKCSGTGARVGLRKYGYRRLSLEIRDPLN
jgi:hypothetical protein